MASSIAGKRLNGWFSVDGRILRSRAQNREFRTKTNHTLSQEKGGGGGAVAAGWGAGTGGGNATFVLVSQLVPDLHDDLTWHLG